MNAAGASYRSQKLALLLAVLVLLPLVGPLEDASEDLRFLARGPRPTSARIVLALADERTFERWREPIMLWSRHLLECTRNARAAGARIVAVDLIPTMEADAFLNETATDTLRLAGLPERTIAQLQPRFDGSERFTPDLTFAGWLGAEVGHVVLATDLDGRLNHVLRDSGVDIALVAPPEREMAIRWFHRRERNVPTLPAVVAARAQGKDPAPISSEPFRINYVDPVPGRAFPVVPLHALDQPDARTAALLDGAIVFLGASDQGLHDVHTGILGREFNGTEILAHATATLLDNRPLRRAPRWAEALATLAAAGIALTLASRLRFAGSGLAVGVLGLAWLGAAQIAFQRGDFLLPIAGPTLGLMLPFAGIHLLHAAQERRARQEVERVFGQYLSPRVRDFLMESEANRSLGGSQTEATVLFFDLRGSTAFAEGKPPAAVIEALNELFAAVIPCIQAQEGLVLKYIGDGFLALFGAPMPLSDHAAAALRSVRAIGEAVRTLNAQRTERGEPAWGFGCGLHSGPLVFGNLGVADRPDFTVIGDTVNLSARLQDASKDFKAAAVLSAATWEAAGRPPDATGPEALTVRGRREPVAVYLLGREGDSK